MLSTQRVRFRAEFVRSRLGRRILILFLFCALLPTATVAFLAFSEVTARLHEQSKSRLRHLSQRAGMAIHERLLQLESELSSLKKPVSRAPKVARQKILAQWLKSRFDRVTIVGADGKTLPVIGGDPGLPQLTPSQAEHIRAGSTVIATTFEEKTPRIYLIRALDPGLPNSPAIFWRVNSSYLWEISDLTSSRPQTELCVLADTGRALHCSLPNPAAFTKHAAKQMHRSESGFFDWEGQETSFLAAYDTISLTADFDAPKWVILVSRARSNILEPLASFRRTFPLAIIGALCLVLLLSSTQIRRSLVPLEQLQRGTRRIADGEFETRVALSSGDEFEELADSFNDMAEQLGRQFNVLATMAEIDRAVLSTIDTPGVVEALLLRIPSLYPCDALSVTLLHPKGGSVAETHVRAANALAGQRKERCTLSAADLEELHSSTGTVVYDDDEDLPSYLLPLASEGARLFIALPILAKSELLGIIALGHSEIGRWDSDQLLQIRRLADQVAIGLSNVRMFERVRFLAYYDELTGLANRVRFQECVREALTQAERHGTSFAVFLLDLDNFKQITDTLGHAVGDSLLQAVAKRLVGGVRRTDAAARAAGQKTETDVARLGGDEFTVLLTGIEDPQDAAEVAARVLATLDQGFRIGSQELFVTASVGIAVSPLDGMDPETLLKNADTAMYHAKDQGGNNFQFYQQSMSAIALHRLTVEGKLRKAIERDEFVLHYQPVVDVETGRMVGVEALLRWSDPVLGVVSPADFISIAEESPIIVRIGEWVLREACAQGVRWRAEGLPRIRVSVNVSGRQFWDDSLVAKVDQALRDTGLDPSCLVVELTESVLMERVRESVILEELKALGLGISIDDFGTGYSSLSYLTQFPVDSLKIDRSFVRGVDTNRRGAAITAAIVAMAQSLDLKVVAEGVETPQELAFLRELGCDEIQGHIFSKPVAAESIAGHLREGTRLPAPRRAARRTKARRKPIPSTRPKRRRRPPRGSR